MILVLDTSAVIEVVLNRPRSSEIIEAISLSDAVITSDLYRAEVGNVLLKYFRAGFIDERDLYGMIGYSDNIVDTYESIEEHLSMAIEHSLKFNHSVYDMLYLSIAIKHNAILVTLDKRLGEIARLNDLDVIPG